MILPLHSLEKTSRTLEMETDPSDFEELEDFHLTGKVGARLEITPLAGDSHLVQGAARGTLNVECARCLEPVKQGFEVNFNLLMERKDATGLDWIEDEDQGVEDYQVRVGPDVTEIPLNSMIAEQVILNYNSQPLPELDAAGRCVQCGRQPPTAPEPEKAATPDPRWEKLASLKNGSSALGGKKSSWKSNKQDK